MANKWQEYQLRGKCYWASVHAPTPKFPAFKVDLAIEDATTEMVVKAIGLKIKSDDKGDHGGKRFVTIKRKPKDRKGVETTHIPVEDEQGNVIKDNVGNGSEVTVHFAAGPFEAVTEAGEPITGVTAHLKKLVVHTLVPYTKG